MDSGRGLSGFARRRANDPQCVVGIRDGFARQTSNLEGCSATHFDCLCRQPAFSNWYLTGICNTCDVNNVAGDPLGLLTEICPLQAESLSGTYSCSNFVSRRQIPTNGIPSVELSLTPSSSPSSPTPAGLAISSTTSSPPPRTTITPFMIPGSAARSSTQPLSTAHTSSNITSTSLLTLSETRSWATITTTADAANSTEAGGLFPSTSTQKSGLSTGAKAGIGIAGGVTLMFLILAIILFCRRQKSRKAGWNSKSVNARDIYPEDGGHSAYALNGGYTQSPIGTALTTENKAQLDANGFVPVVREIYMDEDDDDDDIQPSDSRSNPRTSFQDLPSPVKLSRPPDPRCNSKNNFHDIPSPIVKSRPPHSRSTSQNNFRDIHNPTPRPLSQIPRKEISTPTPPPAYPTALPRNIYTPSPTQGRSDSRISGVLRGPVPEMYAYGGETIENDEELERLEEEERRIDEAIQESERLTRMKAKRDAVRARIEEGRAGRGDI